MRNRFAETRAYLNVRWPTYLLGYGGGSLLGFSLLLFAARQALWGIVALALLLLLLSTFFLGAAIWAAYQVYEKRGQRPADRFFGLGNLEPTAQFVHVSLGRRRTALQMSRRLTSGRLTVIDVYNPQLAPDSAVARARIPPGSSDMPAPDPRIQWRDGQIDLLPLPDGSTRVVTADRLLGHLWQDGDRLLLLRELKRILLPGGKLLLAEEVRTQAAFLAWGPAALRSQTPVYWRTLLTEAGFRLVQETDTHNLLYFFVAEKPHAGEMQQLTFDFGF